MVAFDYSLRDSIAEIEETAWNRCAGPSPHLQHAFFLALERSGSVGPAVGILPKYLLLKTRSDGLVACAPAMLKTGTWREYGPEHGWLNAAAAAGWFAWPKFQVGIPLHPVAGPKLLVRPGMPVDVVHKTFVDVLRTIAERWNLSRAVNVMQVDAATAATLERHGAFISHELRNIWHNPGHTTFDAYLATLPSRGGASAGSVWRCARCTATRSPRRSFLTFTEDFNACANGTEALSGFPRRCSTNSSP